ncbi:MAG: histidine phosphatase family protein [Deltaproteobacteria bacterium]|nr:histidine phosphatase family protein [Deltaproteobacteria bacterium]
MNKELYLLRHGATSMNGLYVGSTDIPLAEKGRAQVCEAGRILQSAGIERIFCSPMKRCIETLGLLKLDILCELNDNLKEINFGRWEGLSFPQINETDPELIEDWRTACESFCFPDGECIKTFNRRIETSASTVLDSAEKRILIIAHGGTIRRLLTLFLGLKPDQGSIFTIQPGRFSTVTLYNELGTLTGLNLGGQPG